MFYDSIVRHVNRHLGNCVTYRGEGTGNSRIDVLAVAMEGHTILITAGMSCQPPDCIPSCPAYIPEICNNSRAELVVGLPAKWSLPEARELFETWVGNIRNLAMYPHNNHTCIKAGTTIPEGDPQSWHHRAYFFTKPTFLSEGFCKLSIGELTIDFLGVVPILPEEYDLVLKHGNRRLLSHLKEKGVTEIMCPQLGRWAAR